jgi:hypothetical protein
LADLDRTNSEDFATIKIREPFRRWLKQQAAKRGTPMYRVLESMVAFELRDRPWDRKDHLPTE